MSIFYFLSCNHSRNNDEQYKQEIHNIIKQYKKDIPETNDISMDEFVNLYFKSNELFLLVDARTDEERKVSIIPRSISKVRRAPLIWNHMH